MIQNHQMVLVETRRILPLIKSPWILLIYAKFGIGVLHYDNSTTAAGGPLPTGPDPFDLEFSINQAKSIRWNLTTGAARPNPQGTFNVHNVTLSQTFILSASTAEINGVPKFTVNNVSYLTPDTPLKLADHLVNGSGVYELDEFSTNSTNVKTRAWSFCCNWDS
ncbi:hypothetical protein M0R45_034006 [Rubus argutus]|uniref:Uncharacterized protein n=1 Tax=Rubus argutus TaxID=59490 RepID=A0AAW1VNV9_RUBAR